jgi:hypothetical protein
MTKENPTIKELEQKEAEIKKRQKETQKLLRAQKEQFAKVLAMQKKIGRKLGLVPDAKKIIFDVADKDIADNRLTRIAEIKRELQKETKDTASAIEPHPKPENTPNTSTRTFEWDLENTENKQDDTGTVVSAKIEPEAVLSKEPVLSAEQMRARMEARLKKKIETPDPSDDGLKKNSKIEIPLETNTPVTVGEIAVVKDKEEAKEKTEIVEEDGFLRPLSFDEEPAEKPKSRKPMSRGKFLKMLGLGILGVGTAGVGIGIGKTEKKLGEAKDNLRSAEKNNTKSQEELAEIAEAKERERIQKIIEKIDMPFFNSLSYAGKIIYLAFIERNENYLMLDKTKAELYTVNVYGSLADKQSVILGRVKGEALNQVSLKHDPNTFGTTPAGIYTLSFDISDAAKAEFGDKAIHLLQVGMEEESNLYIHPVLPEERKRRMKAVESPDTTDNRMSWGCINVPEVESIMPYINKEVAKEPKLIVLPDVSEDGREIWMDPDMGTFYTVGEGESEYKELLTKIEEYANIA